MDFEYTGSRRVVSAIIDPHDRIDMDVNRINNSLTLEPTRTVTRRMLNKFVLMMQMMISIFTI